MGLTTTTSRATPPSSSPVLHLRRAFSLRSSAQLPSGTASPFPVAAKQMRPLLEVTNSVLFFPSAEDEGRAERPARLHGHLLAHGMARTHHQVHPMEIGGIWIAHSFLPPPASHPSHVLVALTALSLLMTSTGLPCHRHSVEKATAICCCNDGNAQFKLAFVLPVLFMRVHVSP